MKKEIGFEIRNGKNNAFIIFELNQSEDSNIVSDELFRVESSDSKIISDDLKADLSTSAKSHFFDEPFQGREINYTDRAYRIQMGRFK